MNDITQTVPQKTLLVWRTFREAIKFWLSHWTILRRGILLGTILGGFSWYFLDIPPFYNHEAEPSSYEILSGTVSVIQALISLTVLDIFLSLTISCHRLILLNNAHDAYHQGFLQGLREFNFSSFLFDDLFHKNSMHWLKEINFFCLFLFVYLGAKLVFFFGQWSVEILGLNWGNLQQGVENDALERIILSLTIFPGFFYFVGRFSLAYPALAVDWKHGLEWSWGKSLEWSWKETKGYGWQLALLVGGIPIILGMSYEFLILLGLQEMVFLDSFLQSFLWFFFSPIEVAVLSIAFRDLTYWTPPTSQSEKAGPIG